jgi:hypothetical protein
MSKETITGGEVSTNYTFYHSNGNTYNLFIYEHIQTPLGIIPMRIVIKKLQRGDIEMDIFQGEVYERISVIIEQVQSLCGTELPYFPNSYNGEESSSNNFFSLRKNWLQVVNEDGLNIFNHFYKQLPKSEAKLYNWAFEKIGRSIVERAER